MIEKIENLPAGCDGLRAIGTLTREDYQQVIEPLFEQAYREGRHLRFLYHLGPQFESFTPGAAWEDMRVGLHYLRLLDRCAVVSDLKWIRDMTRVASFFLPCPFATFANSEWDAAVQWLSTSTPPSNLVHRLLPDVGVLVVEANGPLSATDFESIALTVDPFIEAHGKLHGIVIHAPHFPGWENLSAFTRHLRFVKDHFRYVERVALSVDGRLAELGPKLA
jgi:hypothetical protein